MRHVGSHFFGDCLYPSVDPDCWIYIDIVAENESFDANIFRFSYHAMFRNQTLRQENTVANTFHCTIVTPTEEAFDGDASYVSFPAWDGQYGMMKGLAPLLSTLAPGTLRIDSHEGVSHWYLIEGGFAHVDDGGLTLVTEGAIPAEQLQLEEAQAELAEAKARIAANEGDRQQVERQQRIASAKVTLAQSSRVGGRTE